MANLRSSLIRLAHTNPELRPALLPLLTSGGEARVASPDEINAYNVRRQMDDALTELEAVERVFKSVEYFLNEEETGLGGHDGPGEPGTRGRVGARADRLELARGPVRVRVGGSRLMGGPP